MQTLAAPGVAMPTPELEQPPVYSGELPNVADAITIFRAVTGQRKILEAQYGGPMIARLVEYAHSDMLGAMQAGQEPFIAGNLEEYHLSGVRADDLQVLRWPVHNLRIESEAMMSWAVDASTPDGYEIAVDSLVVPRHRSPRGRLPLYWFSSVLFALDRQAESASEEDRLRAAELLGRVAPLPVEQPR